MSVSSASTHSRLGSAFYRGDSSIDYHGKYGSSFSSRSPSLDNGFMSSSLPRRHYQLSTSSTVRPLPVGPSSVSNSQYDSPSSASPSSSSSVRSIPIRYNDTSATSSSTLGRRTGASSKPPLPSSAFERASSSLGTRYSSTSSDLLPPAVNINRYIRSSSTDRSSAPPSVHQRHYGTDEQYRRLPVNTNVDIFERLSEPTRSYSATYTSRRPSTTGHEDYLRGRSPSPLSSQRSYMNGTNNMRIVPIYYDRERDEEERDVLASLMTSPSASSGIGSGVSGGTAGGSMSQTGLYRSRVGAVSVPDVPTYARGHLDETSSSANANLNSSASNNGYASDSRRNSLTNSSLERQELEDDDEESKDEATSKEEAELRRKYSPANYRRPSENDNWSSARHVSSTEAETRPAGRHVPSSEPGNWTSGRSTASAPSNNTAGSGANNAFVKNEPNRSSTSSVDSSESSRLSSGRSSNVSEGVGNTRYGESSRFIRDDDNNDAKKCGLTGLRNLGNTCFMNSVIQCLSNTRPLRDYCLHSSSTLSTDINNNTTSRMKGALIKAFRELLSELWSTTKGGYVTPDRFKTQIQKFAPRFTGYNQQDAQEFLRYLLQGLHEDINRVQTRPPALPPIEDTLADSHKALESWKRYLRVDESKVVDIFVGQLKSELKCTVCGNISTTFDPFWDLSLPIPQDTRSIRNQVTLNDCLDAFTKEEVLDGDEKPTCDVCKTRRRCTKKFSIQKYPSVLVLHLKRFSGERYRSRLSTLVDFPLTKLDLSPYASPKSAVTPTYDLYAVSNHSGTPMTGHYTAYCKNPRSGNCMLYHGDGRWYLFDDSRVSPVNDRSVISSEAYVLFYELSPSGSSSRL